MSAAGSISGRAVVMAPAPGRERKGERLATFRDEPGEAFLDHMQRLGGAGPAPATSPQAAAPLPEQGTGASARQLPHGRTLLDLTPSGAIEEARARTPESHADGNADARPHDGVDAELAGELPAPQPWAEPAMTQLLSNRLAAGPAGAAGGAGPIGHLAVDGAEGLVAVAEGLRETSTRSTASVSDGWKPERLIPEDAESARIGAARTEAPAIGHRAFDLLRQTDGPLGGSARGISGPNRSRVDAGRVDIDGGTGGRASVAVVLQQTHLPPAMVSLGAQIGAAASAELGATRGQEPLPRPSGEPASVPAPVTTLRLLHLQLEPAELGKVTIRLALRAATLDVRLEVQHSATADLMRRDSGTVSSLLRSAGYDIGDLSIQVVPMAERPITAGAPGLDPAMQAFVSRAPSEWTAGDSRSGDGRARPAPREEMASAGADARENPSSRPAGPPGIYV